MNDLKSGGQSVFQDSGKWHDTVGGTHNSRKQAEFALQKVIQEREYDGVNTLTKADGVCLLVWFVAQIILFVFSYFSFKSSSFLGGLLFGAGGLALLALGYKFFFSTKPSFREKIYFVIGGVLIAGFLLAKVFNFS